MSEEAKNPHEIMLTPYDRLLRSWENSMEMVRDFEMHAKRIEDDKLKDVFKKFAEEEGLHASKFRDILLEMKDRTDTRDIKVNEATFNSHV